MTGEITLRGRVLPIGGLKEKIIAAHRHQIKTVLIPRDNEKDIKEIPARILKAVELVAGAVDVAARPAPMALPRQAGAPAAAGPGRDAATFRPTQEGTGEIAGARGAAQSL